MSVKEVSEWMLIPLQVTNLAQSKVTASQNTCCRIALLGSVNGDPGVLS